MQAARKLSSWIDADHVQTRTTGQGRDINALREEVRNNLAESLDVISRSNELRIKAHDDRMWVRDLRERTKQLRAESNALFASVRSSFN